MTRSVYVVGAAAAGKSTFMAHLLDELGAELGELEDLHTERNAKASVTLRGHRFLEGVYLGKMRELHPGADGLDRASSPVGAAWLRTAPELPERIIGEGLTLCTEPFMTALVEESRLLLVHLTVSPQEQERRCAARGSSQQESFLKISRTRAANTAELVKRLGGHVLPASSQQPQEVELALDLATGWLAL